MSEGFCLGCGEYGNRCRCDEPCDEESQTMSNISFTEMRDRFFFDKPTNEITLKALQVLQELCDWFEHHHPDCTSKPNLRIGRELLAVCIGDEAVWNSTENYAEELNCEWMLKAYEKDMRERLEMVEKWKATKEDVE